jgi:hypothetical protein
MSFTVGSMVLCHASGHNSRAHPIIYAYTQHKHKVRVAIFFFSEKKLIRGTRNRQKSLLSKRSKSHTWAPLTRILTPSCLYIIHIGYECASVILIPPPPPTCFSAESYENIRPIPIGRRPSVATTGNTLLLVDMRREPAAFFYLLTGESLRGISGAYTQWTGPIHAKFFHFLIPY